MSNFKECRMCGGRGFGALPDPVAQRVAAASTAEIEHWFDRAVDAASLDHVFAMP